ncbi:AAA family ATPase [Bradyrhizobium sp.]|uniref:bifunctional aminoglycoside phosphotransferase/ATP-binding protein n=1 Tax=Bradyrhizobium sp. TaxID=376 RepID=UPI003C50DA7D
MRFPFLDYSTLAKRKTACDDEIRVNRQFAPQVYRRVVPITRDSDGHLGIDGAGTPIEFAVEMARFDERQTIDHLAEAGPLDAGLVDGIADAIANSHKVAPRADAVRWIRSIAGIIADNTAASLAAGRFAADEIDDLHKASLAAFSRIRGCLEQRGRQGQVRRCHGDLHLANIVLIDQKPVLFDAIEFDETIASIDVLYDLAFALMDLLRYRRRAEANRLFNRYLSITPPENLDALSALPLFLSMRSAIRAHVLLVRLDRATSDQAGIIETAGAYFGLARASIHPPAPMLIAVGGLSGTGKSVLARALAPLVAPLPGAVVLRSDVLRKQLFAVGETERLPANAYDAEVGAQIYDTMARRASQVLAQGHSVIVDAVFAREAERAAIRDAARRADTGFVGLFLVADLATRQSRVERRKADASDATPEIAELQETYDAGTIDWEVVSAAGTPEAVLQECEKLIADLTTAS